MQNAIRTTIRLRKDLLDQSRLVAIQENTSVQNVINSTLAKGFGRISDLEKRRIIMKRIDNFRKSISGKNINAQRVYEASKKELEDRTDRLLNQTSK